MALSSPTALGTQQASAASSTIASITLAAGDFLFVGGSSKSSGATSVMWGSENLVDDTPSGQTGTGNVRVWGWSKIIATGGTQTITVNIASQKHAWFAIKVTGVVSSSQKDQGVSQTVVSTTSPSSGAAGTTVQAGEILIGVVSIGQDVAVGGAWSNSFTGGQSANTTGGSAAGNASVNEGYRIVSATGAYTAAKTGATSANTATLILTYKAAPGSLIYKPNPMQPFLVR